MSERTDFTVGRKDWGDTRFESHAAGDLQAGQVRLRVDRFALTSNNISYAASGDMLGYWGFFPAEQGRGRIPVMGLGDVLESANPDVAEGTRVFGFAKPASGVPRYQPAPCHTRQPSRRYGVSAAGPDRSQFSTMGRLRGGGDAWSGRSVIVS